MDYSAYESKKRYLALPDFEEDEDTKRLRISFEKIGIQTRKRAHDEDEDLSAQFEKSVRVRPSSKRNRETEGEGILHRLEDDVRALQMHAGQDAASRKKLDELITTYRYIRNVFMMKRSSSPDTIARMRMIYSTINTIKGNIAPNRRLL